MYIYEPLEKSWPSKFLPSQSDSLVMATRPAVGYYSRFVIGEGAIHNRSGSSAVVGIGGRLPVDLWKAGQWTDATTTYTDDTTDAQDAGTSDFALDTLNTDNDGFIVLSLVPFNIISVVVGTADAGGAPVYDLAYSIAGGTWTTLTNTFVAPTFGATGEQLIWFADPANWAVTEAGHATGIPTGYYAIRVRATTAPTGTAGLASVLVLGKMFYSTEGIADNATWVIPQDGELWLPPQCDAIMPAISVANIQNRATIHYRMTG